MLVQHCASDTAARRPKLQTTETGSRGHCETPMTIGLAERCRQIETDFRPRIPWALSVSSVRKSSEIYFPHLRADLFSDGSPTGVGLLDFLFSSDVRFCSSLSFSSSSSSSSFPELFDFVTRFSDNFAPYWILSGEPDPRLDSTLTGSGLKNISSHGGWMSAKFYSAALKIGWKMKEFLTHMTSGCKT